MMRVILLLATVLLGEPKGELIDQVVAVVDKEAITGSRLALEARVALALREGEAAARVPFTPELLVPLRDYLINQMLVASQARRLGTGDISEADVDARCRQLVQRFHSMESYQEFLQRFGISDSTVRDIVRRDLSNEIYVARRMKTRMSNAMAPVIDSELDEDAYAAKYQSALQAFIDELRQAAEIRLLGTDGELELVTRVAN